MVLQFMLEGPQPCTILCFNVHITIKYLNRNDSIGQLLQHISKYIVVCARSRPKTLIKTYNKEVCQASLPLPFVNYGQVNATEWALCSLQSHGTKSTMLRRKLRTGKTKRLHPVKFD